MRFSGDSAPGFSTKPSFRLSSAAFRHAMRPRWGAHTEASLECRQILLQYIGAKPIEGELPLSPRLDQPGPCKLLQVMRHRRLGDRELLAQPLAADFTTVGDLFENLKPPRIGERLGNAGEPFVIDRHRLYR